ncbi:hypothetical protein [Arenimonas oryziterrae]|uniref:Lipocalin-like domain-containing protein n=1 Tax=Arenimonas oryziterrae DSM 21050 = YC6267 TaxID=1121015 RepID=A0A091AM82_9GAMM|nr:hypothetical protein [Arenimonas oryziterrae]KFN41313.1 hypothetical protein N789_05400 [Arenimonas oryziterrae DSM 21050 = YC6267]
MKRFLALLLAVLLLAACAKPIPADKQDFVGYWQAPNMAMLITADGRLKYKREKGTGNVSIDAPIKAFENGGFTSGIGPLTTFFKIDKTPHEEDGVWKMTIDGVELQRTTATLAEI